MAVLVDTNVLVRAVQGNHPPMRTARQALRSLVQNGEELCVTWQNIAEFWNLCTRPVDANGLGSSIAATDGLTSRVEMFFTVLPDSPEAFREWRRLVATHEVRGAKVHDARLAAIMQAHGIKRILTLQYGRFQALHTDRGGTSCRPRSLSSGGIGILKKTL
jgi:predicted nucleic acid-binding protein